MVVSLSTSCRWNCFYYYCCYSCCSCEVFGAAAAAAAAAEDDASHHEDKDEMSAYLHACDVYRDYTFCHYCDWYLSGTDESVESTVGQSEVGQPAVGLSEVELDVWGKVELEEEADEAKATALLEQEEAEEVMSLDRIEAAATILVLKHRLPYPSCERLYYCELVLYCCC